MDKSLEPSLEQVRAIAASESYRCVPVKRELMADRITVIEAFRALSTESSHCFMLESAEPDQHTGRYSFLGFDAISTLSEETVDPRRSIPRAIFIATLLGGAIFIISTYLLMVAHPSLTFESIDTAAYEIVGQVGGETFKTVFTVVVAIAFFAAGLCAHASASRLLLVMGRDDMIPAKPFGYISPRFKTPLVNIVLVGLVMLAAMKFDISTSTAFINFGAFTAFFAVNAAVIALLTRNSAERKGRLALMIVAIFGAAFCGSLFLSLDRLALELGLSWFAIGIVYLLAKTRVLKRPLPRLATDI